MLMIFIMMICFFHFNGSSTKELIYTGSASADALAGTGAFLQLVITMLLPYWQTIILPGIIVAVMFFFVIHFIARRHRIKRHQTLNQFSSDYLRSISPKLHKKKEDSNQENIETSLSVAAVDDCKIKNYTILIIDDCKIVLSFIRQILEKNYHVIESQNGMSGWKKATNIIPDLIISDIIMPGLDGCSLCHRLKKDKRTSHIPIILLTAITSENYHISGLENGADIYLTKPFSPQVLKLYIRNMLRLGEKTREFVKKKFCNAQPEPEVHGYKNQQEESDIAAKKF